MSDVVELLLRLNDSETAAKLKAVKEQATGVQVAFNATSDATGKTDERMKALGQATEKTRGGIAALASALGVISPEAQKVASTVGASAGALDGFGKIAAGLGASAGPIAILVVAIGALAAAYKGLSDNLKEAEEKAAKFGATATMFQDVGQQIKLNELKAAAARGETGAADALLQFQTDIEVNKQFGGQIQEAQGLVSQKQSALEAIGNVDSPRRRQAEQEVAAAQADLDRLLVMQSALRDSLINLADSTSGATEGVKGVAKAAKAIEAPTKANVTGVGAMNAIVPNVIDPDTGLPFGMSPVTELPAEFASIQDTTLQANVTGVRGAPMTFSERMAGLGGLSPIGALAMGNGAAAFGPFGGLASGVAGIGQMGATGVRNKLFDFKEDIEAGLRALPEILTEVIPDFAGALVSDLPPAIARSLAELLLGNRSQADLNGNGDVTMLERAGSLAKRNLVGFGQLATLGFGDDLLRLARGGNSRAVGGYVDTTGIALVHQGERIVQSHDAARMAGGGGRKTEIHVHGSLLDHQGLMDAIDRAQGYGGAGAYSQTLATR